MLAPVRNDTGREYSRAHKKFDFETTKAIEWHIRCGGDSFKSYPAIYGEN